MDHYFKFAVVRFNPDVIRGEVLNIGLVVASDNGLDVRLSRKIDKARSISNGVDVVALGQLVQNLKIVDEKLRNEGLNLDGRLVFLSKTGPISFSPLGAFRAETSAIYEERLSQIFKSLIDPEPALKRVREKRSKLLTQVKMLFKQEGVLAQKDEGLDSHRIVAGLELDEGLVADFILKNGSMHVVETVDASGDESSLRKAIGEIGTAALVLERARMRFGESKTKSRLVYIASPTLERIALPSLEAAQHQGAELVNWASANDRNKFVNSLASLATPFESKREQKAKAAVRRLPL